MSYHPPIKQEISAYIERITSAFPKIKSIWFLGSRANGTDKPDSDWDFLVFGTHAVLAALRADVSFCRDDMDLLIVTDGDRFECPWLQSGRLCIKSGNLYDVRTPGGGAELNFGWEFITEREARYFGNAVSWERIEQRAFRVFSR